MTTSKNFKELSGSSRVIFLMKLYTKKEGKRVWNMGFINSFFCEEIAIAKPGRVISIVTDVTTSDKCTYDLMKDELGNTSVAINNFNEPTQF